MKFLSFTLLLISMAAEANDSLSCFKTVCGAGPEIKTYSDLFVEDMQAEFKDTEFEQELVKLINRSLDKQEEQWGHRHKFLEEVRNDAALVKARSSEISLTLHNIMDPVLTNFPALYENGSVSALYFFTTPMIFFNEVTAREVLKEQYQGEELDWVIRLNAAFYNEDQYSRIIKYILGKKTLPQYVFNNVIQDSDVSVMHAIHLDIEKTVARLDKINLAGLPQFDREFIKIIREKMVAVGELNEFPEFVADAVNTNLFLAQIIINTFLSSQDRFMTVAREMPASLGEKYLEKIANLESSEFDPKRIDPDLLAKKRQETINTCLSQVKAVLNVSPDFSDIKKIPSSLRKIKSGAVQFVANNFGHTLSRYVDSKLNYLQFEIPGSQQFVKNYIRSSFLDDVRYPSDKFYSEMALLNEDTFDADEHGSVFEYDLHEMCSPFTPSPDLDDKIFVTGNLPLLNVSLTTAKHFKDFELVLTHEVGHFVYQLLKGQKNPNLRDFDQSMATLKKIEDKLACVSGGHPVSPKVDFTIDLENDVTFKVGQYTSEDFADLFAAAISDKDTPNSFCRLISKYESGQLLLDLANTYAEDPHSSVFYRILNVEKNLKGSLPEPCERVLSSQEAEKISQCFVRN